MKLIKLQDKNSWDSFVKKADDGMGAELLQSYFWGNILKKKGAEVLRLAVEEDGKILASASLIHKPLFSRWSYWYCPRGPLGSTKAINFLIAEIKKQYPRILFLRMEPQKLKRGKKTIDLQPKKTLMLDLECSEEELLKDMHQKTRYNIRLAQKKGVSVVEGGINDFAEFWRLMKLTSVRDGFRVHQKEHYENLLANGEGVIKIFFSRHGDKNIATGLFSFWGNRATYLHGASDNKFRNVMAPYLLQWEVIKRAQAVGLKCYDFYGIDAQKWPGVTRFKLGFGGQEANYPGTFDVVFSPCFYFIYRLLRQIKRLI